MSARGTYGEGSSLGAWLIGALAAGGAVLWAKHQSDQIERLYVATGLPYQGFTRSLRSRAGELSGAAGTRLQGLAARLGTRKELKDGT